MNRRTFLTAVAGTTTLLAGCSSSNNTDEEENGEQITTETTSDANSLTDFVELSSHEFTYSSTGLVLKTTVKNVSGNTLDLINIQSNLYEGDTRIANSSMNVSELGAGIKDTAEMSFYDAEPSDLEKVGSYEITVQTAPEIESYERTYSFEEFKFPPE